MVLRMFREHLADELRHLPQESGPFASYAVTTAALARVILEHLNIDDLTVPDPVRGRTYKLRTVLDRVMHFRELYPEMGFGTSKPTSFAVYSDRARLYRDRLYVAWTPYREIISRLAEDDVFVARYLLRRTVTLLTRTNKGHKVVPRSRSLEAGEFRRNLHRLVLDSWDMLICLLDAGEVEVPCAKVDCYEEHDGGTATQYSGISTYRELVEGYGTLWEWAPFNTDQLEIDTAEVWVVFLLETERKEDGTLRGLAVSFETLIGLFQAVRKQLE